MPNSTVRANARTMPEKDQDRPAAVTERNADRIRFEAAVFEWFAARAALQDPSGDDADEVRDKLFFREMEARIKVIQIPAPYAGAVLQKLEAVEVTVNDDAAAGQPAFPLAIIGLASIRADLLALDLI